jgi:hypothetical protein
MIEGMGAGCGATALDGEIVRQGKWTFNLPSGARLEGTFVDGLREGRFAIRDAAGRVQKTTEYVNDTATGVEMEYHPDGSIFGVRHFDRGALHGEVLTRDLPDTVTRERWDHGKQLELKVLSPEEGAASLRPFEAAR